MPNTILYVSPEAPVAEEVPGTERRALSSGGLRVGVLDNSKGNADHLLAFLIESLRARVNVASVVTMRKPTAARPAETHVLDNLYKEADFVVSAMAD